MWAPTSQSSPSRMSAKARWIWAPPWQATSPPTGQDQAGFDALEQVVLVARLPVSAISFSPGAMPLIVATCARPGSSDGAMLDRR